MTSSPFTDHLSDIAPGHTSHKACLAVGRRHETRLRGSGPGKEPERDLVSSRTQIVAVHSLTCPSPEVNEIQVHGLTPRLTEVWTVLSEARYSKNWHEPKVLDPAALGVASERYPACP